MSSTRTSTRRWSRASRRRRQRSRLEPMTPSDAPRRSVSRTFRDFQGYLLRVLTGRQRPVRFADLPRDMRWFQVSLWVFLAVSEISWLVDGTWLDLIHYLTFAVAVGLYVRSF